VRQIHGFTFGRRPKWYLYLVILATALLVSTLWAGLSFAQGTRVLVSPSAQSIPTIGVTTTVDIRIEDVTNLYGAEVFLSFAPGILEVQGIADGDLLTGGFLAAKTWDNNAGTLNYAYTLLFPATVGVDGSGVLCTITFKGIGVGTSLLRFTEVNLSDPNGLPITASSQDGSITVGTPIPVGGVIMPVNRPELLARQLRSGLAPGLRLAALAGLAALTVALIRRRKT